METNYLINIKIVTLHLFYINCRLNENQIDFYSEYQTYRLLTPGQQLNNFALNQLVKAGHKNTFIQRTDQTELDWYFPLSINGHFLTSRLKLVNYPWQLFFLHGQRLIQRLIATTFVEATSTFKILTFPASINAHLLTSRLKLVNYLRF